MAKKQNCERCGINQVEFILTPEFSRLCAPCVNYLAPRNEVNIL